MRLQILMIVCFALGLGGCAGNAKSTKTQDNAETDSEAQIAESIDGPIFKDQGSRNDFFDPFDESDQTQTKEYDPLEPVNSAVFEFNYRVDKYVVKPSAKVYNFFIPPDVQQSVSNVFHNIRFVPRFLNNLFQAKLQGAGIELSRFLINSTLGVGGLFDPAKIMFELETPQEDLGQTLGTYGVPPGPFLMIPFLGPFTLRDGIGFIGDTFLDPFNWLVLPIFEIADAPRLLQHDPTINYARLGMSGGETVNLRALSLEKFQGVEEGTLDLYGAVRNAYLQQRLNAIQE
jgi:phospholipid-binding lipoprotein MlaA